MNQLAEEVYLEAEYLPLDEYYSTLVYVAVNKSTYDYLAYEYDLIRLDGPEKSRIIKTYGVEITSRYYTTFDGSCHLTVYIEVDDAVPDQKACIRKAKF